MPNLTTNYQLKKPLENEYYDVAVDNENADKIDTQLKANADNIEAHKNSTTAHDASKLTYTGAASNNTPVTIKKALDDTDERIDTIVASVGNTNTEIVDARDNLTGTSYPTLKDRLDTEYEEVTQQLAETVGESVQKYAYMADEDAGDWTRAFQTAADTGKPVIVPKHFTYYKVSNPIYLNNSLVGVNNPEVKMFGATGSANKTMFVVHGFMGDYMEITGLTLDGQRDTDSPPGEHDHLVRIGNSKNVVVHKNILKNPFGDCVFIGSIETLTGQWATPGQSENIKVLENELLNSYRCNIAVTSGKEILIEGNTIQKTNGYGSAIDLEPNANGTEDLEGVTIRDNTFDSTATFVNIYSPNARPITDITITKNKGNATRFVGGGNGAAGYFGSKLVIEDNYFSGTGTTSSLFLANIDSSTVVEIKNNVDNISGNGTGWVIYDGVDMIIEENRIIGTKDTSLTLYNPQKAKVLNNTFKNASNACLYFSDGFGNDPFTFGNRIEGNYFSNNKGILFTSEAWDCVVSNNEFDCTLYGVYVAKSTSVVQILDNNTFKDGANTVVYDAVQPKKHYSPASKGVKGYEELWITSLNDIDTVKLNKPTVIKNANPSTGATFQWVCTESGKYHSITPNATATNGSNVLTSVSFLVGWLVGDTIKGTGIPSGTTITGVDSSASTITMSNNFTGASGTIQIYDAVIKPVAVVQ